MTKPAKRIEDYPVVASMPVHWGDMDAYGHVNNAVYFRYLETARMHYLERVGFLESYSNYGIGAILHSTSCRFRSPLRFPDDIRVATDVTELRRDRFIMEYIIVSQDGTLVAEADAVIVSFDYRRGVKCAVPDEVASRIGELSPDAL